MNEQMAREIFAKTGTEIHENNGLYNLGHYISWDSDSTEICLDCHFDIDELEAIVWWMRNKYRKIQNND